MIVDYPIKIITLWVVFLLGLIFHTQLGLMPLFHGLNIVESKADTITSITPILWLMLAFFVLPMVAIVASLFTQSFRYRRLHFGLTVIYTCLNVAHVIADLLVSPIAWYQITLMVILLVIGLLLNLVSWQWLKLHRAPVPLLGR